MIPYDEDATEKHNRMNAGRTKDFSIRGLMQNDTGLSQTDGEEGNLHPTEFKRRFNKEIVIKSSWK